MMMGLLKKIESMGKKQVESRGEPSGESPGELVIEERDGVPYIKKEALSSGAKPEKKLNPEFKKLIDSIM
ncbi:hypothetical protein FACS189461_2480 [Spirochaetia bacterium]|nr:hypothetical protein FACS189461_2480 [Spirochaetia bacterium]